MQVKTQKKQVKKLPKKYKEWIPRVSELVSFVYPFESKFFLKWLESKWISEEDYMKEATEWWTFIHNQLEKYLLWEEVKSSKYDDYIISGQEAIEELWIEPIYMEHYIWREDIQWTIDLVAKIDWKKWIIDFKTYNLSKDMFWLENKYKKPTDKLKKATLQLSVYAELMNIKNIGVIELTKDWYHWHKLKKLNKDKINEYLLKFNESCTDKDTNIEQVDKNIIE